MVRLLTLLADIRTIWKNIVKDKHSSLFCSTVSDKQKNKFVIDTIFHPIISMKSDEILRNLKKEILFKFDISKKICHNIFSLFC